MKKVVTRLSALVMALLLAAAACADSLTVRWSELSPVIANRTVTLTLPGGAQLRGKALAVESRNLIIEIRKTSSPTAHPKGRQSIPRAQIASLQVSRPTKRWRIIGTVAGAVVGVPLGALGAIKEEGILSQGNGGTAIALAIIGGATAAGYFIGRAADRRTTTITIATEPEPH